MVVPRKLTLKFDQLHVLPIQFADNPGLPVLMERGERDLKIDLVHFVKKNRLLLLFQFRLFGDDLGAFLF